MPSQSHNWKEWGYRRARLWGIQKATCLTLDWNDSPCLKSKWKTIGWCRVFPTFPYLNNCTHLNALFLTVHDTKWRAVIILMCLSQDRPARLEEIAGFGPCRFWGRFYRLLDRELPVHSQAAALLWFWDNWSFPRDPNTSRCRTLFRVFIVWGIWWTVGTQCISIWVSQCSLN